MRMTMLVERLYLAADLGYWTSILVAFPGSPLLNVSEVVGE